MRKFLNSEQNGRSMVEMLGVLAIIGVLSVGGISGYSKAMAKFKMSKAMDQMSMTVANIRTAYGSMSSYADLDDDAAITYGLVGADMLNSDKDTIINAFSGEVHIKSATVNGIENAGFSIVYNGLDRDACLGLATADWGTAGILGMTVGGAKVDDAGEAPDITVDQLPVSLKTAAEKCTAITAANAITWYYY